MAFITAIFLVVITSTKGAEGCSFATLNIPVVPFCNNHIRNGQAIVVSSNDVPQNQEVTCKCDVTVAGTDELLVSYESPDYTNCGVQIQIDNMVYSCQDSVTSIDVSNRQQFQMVYKKTTSTTNPNMCMMLRSVSSAASSIKVTCEETDDKPVTLKQTTTQKPVYTSSTQSPYTHYTDRQNSSTHTSSVITNITQESQSKSSFSSTNITTPTAATASVTQYEFSSSASPTLYTTAKRTDLQTSHATSNQSEIITYLTSSTNMPTQRSNPTTIAHLTSEDTQERSSPSGTSRITQKKQTSPFSSTHITTPIADTLPTTQALFSSAASSTLSTTTQTSDIRTSQATSRQSENITYQTSNPTTFENSTTAENTNEISPSHEIHQTTQKKQTSKTLQSSSTPLSLPPTDGSDSTSNVLTSTAADFITTTHLSTGQSQEDSQFKTVIIICSVLGCVLLMVVAVTLAILIYKNRNSRKKNTLNTDIDQPYIHAFDPERRESKDDGVFLNRVLLTDHVNDPLTALYCIPHNVKGNTDITTKHNSRTEVDGNSSVPRTNLMEDESLPLKFEAKNNKRIASPSRRASETPVMDTGYDHLDNRRERARDKVLQDLEVKYDHVNRFQDNQSNVWKSTGWVQSEGSRDPLVGKPTDLFDGEEKHYQTEPIANEKQGNNDIYTIVRKPRDTYAKKKGPKLVTFKGFDDLEGDTYNGSKGILKNKNTEIHDVHDQPIFDKQSLYYNTKIPRAKLDRVYLYSTGSKVNRSDEEKVFHDQVVGHI